MEKNKNNGMSRRKFIGNVSLATAGITILPSHVVGGLGYVAPSDKLNIAGIGVGGVDLVDMILPDESRSIPGCFQQSRQADIIA